MANSYASTLTVNLENQQNQPDFTAVVTGSAAGGGRDEIQFNQGGAAIFDVNAGEYRISILSNAGLAFSVDVLNDDECDGIIGSDNDNEVCDVVLGNRFDVGFGTGTVRLGDDRFGTEVISSPDTLPPAKFTVKTQISDECLSSPLCKVITERDITEDVYEFISVSNKYNHVSNFPGSNLSRILIFDSDYYFRYGLHQVEAFTDSKIFPKDNHGESIKVNIEYHNCSVYLKPGQEVNCIITIKPYDESLVEKNSTTQ